MIQIDNTIKPPKAVLDRLKRWQDAITGTFSEKSEKAKKFFKQRNVKTNKTYQVVKQYLTIICSGARRCVYCGDSCADEVEHIHPKNLYPDLVFVWENYVYACGPCNGPKNNKFAVFHHQTGVFTAVNPVVGAPASQPPDGHPVLINPRIEDPLTFAVLDLSGTFRFVPLPGLTAEQQQRFDYTYNEVLRLNHTEREYLCEAREEAFGDYRARLIEYDLKKQQGEVQALLDRKIAQLKKKSHPTVFREMQRYHREGWLQRVDDELYTIFDRNPEIATW